LVFVFGDVKNIFVNLLTKPNIKITQAMLCPCAALEFHRSASAVQATLAFPLSFFDLAAEVSDCCVLVFFVLCMFPVLGFMLFCFKNSFFSTSKIAFNHQSQPFQLNIDQFSKLYDETTRNYQLFCGKQNRPTM
jgi:hypothetical protein